MLPKPSLDDDRAWQLYLNNDKELLESAAAERESASRDKVELCAVINAKSGRCSEDRAPGAFPNKRNLLSNDTL